MGGKPRDRSGYIKDVENLSFCVESWYDQTYTTEAACSNASLAIAAYDAAIVREPGRRILLRQGARVIRDSQRGQE